MAPRALDDVISVVKSYLSYQVDIYAMLLGVGVFSRPQYKKYFSLTHLSLIKFLPTLLFRIVCFGNALINFFFNFGVFFSNFHLSTLLACRDLDGYSFA